MRTPGIGGCRRWPLKAAAVQPGMPRRAGLNRLLRMRCTSSMLGISAFRTTRGCPRDRHGRASDGSPSLVPMNARP
jgi:hypothetical protein